MESDKAVDLKDISSQCSEVCYNCRLEGEKKFVKYREEHGLDEEIKNIIKKQKEEYGFDDKVVKKAFEVLEGLESMENTQFMEMMSFIIGTEISRRYGLEWYYKVYDCMLNRAASARKITVMTQKL